LLILALVLMGSAFVALLVDGHSRADSTARGEAITERWDVSTLLGLGTFAAIVGGYLAFQLLI